MRRVLIALAISFLGPCALADEAAIEKYRNFLPEELLALSEEERHSSVPWIYTSAAITTISTIGDLDTQSKLNALMYGAMNDFEGAKKAFQSDLGEEPTGRLTVSQLHTLAYRASRQNMTRVSLLFGFTGGLMDSSRALVKGTLKIHDENIAHPINHVWIECDRANLECDYRQIALILPDEDSWVQTYLISEIASETYRVTRWEGRQIDATPMDTDGCRISQLNLDFEADEYFEVARNNGAGDCETSLGVTLPRLEKPRVSQIIDGQELIHEEFNKIAREAYSFLASEYRARIDKALTVKE